MQVHVEEEVSDLFRNTVLCYDLMNRYFINMFIYQCNVEHLLPSVIMKRKECCKNAHEMLFLLKINAEI